MTDSPSPTPPPLSQIAVHTMTNKPWTLRECIEAYERAGIGGISVWREHIEPIGPDEASQLLADCSLRVSALVRGGFFVHPGSAEQQSARDEMRRCIDEATTIGASMVVIVPGAHPDVSLVDGRALVRDGLAAVLDHASKCSVRLALEPLHPMYAADRSCINTLGQACRICDAINHPLLGVAVDVYHTWWDESLESEIETLGESGRLFAFHVNDWLPETSHLLTDRGLMGEGCIPIRRIRSWMERAGFDGMIEVEILSERWWRADQREFLDAIVEACANHT